MAVQITWKRPDSTTATLRPQVVAGGIDFGYGDPLAIAVGMKVGPVWLGVDEVYVTRADSWDIRRHLLRLRNRYHVQRWWADSEDPKEIANLQRAGLDVFPNEIHEIDYGLRVVNGLLRRTVDHPVLGRGPRLRFLAARCPHTMREFNLYRFPKVRGEFRTQAPLDRDNHLPDAWRYLLTNEGEMPPELEEAAPEERPTMYVGEDGRWRDDPRATIARRAAGGWDEDAIAWDETYPGDPMIVMDGAPA